MPGALSFARVCQMSRRIPNLHYGVALYGLIAFAAGPGLPREHLQEQEALAKCWQDLGAGDAELAGRTHQNPQVLEMKALTKNAAGRANCHKLLPSNGLWI
jgi:hypothetical protein